MLHLSDHVHLPCMRVQVCAVVNYSWLDDFSPCHVIVLAVGKSGQVYSFESTSHHMEAARTNFKRWCNNWELVHSGGDEGRGAWPDNVLFVEDDVSNAASYIASDVDAVSELIERDREKPGNPCCLCLLAWACIHVLISDITRTW